MLGIEIIPPLTRANEKRVHLLTNSSRLPEGIFILPKKGLAHA
jgi:hypothetical protein